MEISIFIERKEKKNTLKGLIVPNCSYFCYFLVVGNKAKCQKILEKAEIFGAEPVNLLKKAIKNLNAGKSYLLTADEKAQYFEQS